MFLLDIDMVIGQLLISDVEERNVGSLDLLKPPRHLANPSQALLLHSHAVAVLTTGPPETDDHEIEKCKRKIEKNAKEKSNSPTRPAAVLTYVFTCAGLSQSNTKYCFLGFICS